MSRFRLRIIGTMAVLGATMAYQGSAVAVTGPSGGDFIVRCFYNGNTAPMDPILDPGSTTTDHLAASALCQRRTVDRRRPRRMPVRL